MPARSISRRSTAKSGARSRSPRPPACARGRLARAGPSCRHRVRAAGGDRVQPDFIENRFGRHFQGEAADALPASTSPEASESGTRIDNVAEFAPRNLTVLRTENVWVTTSDPRADDYNIADDAKNEHLEFAHCWIAQGAGRQPWRSVGLRTAAGRADPLAHRRLDWPRARGPATCRNRPRAAREAFLAWRRVPAPARGELVRRIGLAFREHKEDLAALGDAGGGQDRRRGPGRSAGDDRRLRFRRRSSRQLYGLTIASERPGHRLMEQWHPLGPVGVITAFNFPVAVWAWNAMLALVCGDHGRLEAVGKNAALRRWPAQAIVQGCWNRCRSVPAWSAASSSAASRMSASHWPARGLPLISATGSVPMGRRGGQTVAARLGRALLELGGNNG